MVDDQVGHQLVILGYLLDLLPVTERRIDHKVIHNGEAVVGAEWKEGQDMYCGDIFLQMFIEEPVQGNKRQFIIVLDGVAISDNDTVTLIPEIPVGDRELDIAPHAHFGNQLGAQCLAILVRVDDSKVLCYPAMKFLFRFFGNVFHVTW